jgi:hypothetical protein
MVCPEEQGTVCDCGCRTEDGARDRRNSPLVGMRRQEVVGYRYKAKGGGCECRTVVDQQVLSYEEVRAYMKTLSA